jgi:thiosulfate/3-mercaptopyruvate sulfurtransferase
MSTATAASPWLVSTEALARDLGKPGLVVLDGSWHMPASKRDPLAEHRAAHIPGALYFDIDACADKASDLPHMLPNPAEFERYVGGLGISNSDRVVVYATKGSSSAPRVWWMLRAMGHDDVAVLDGGLAKWQAEGRPVSDAPVSPAAGKRFSARFRPELVMSADGVLGVTHSGAAQVLDARSAGRFTGSEPEPRAGLRSGRIPGSWSLPFGELMRADGTFKPAAELEAAFRKAGIDPDRPVVTSCGSGVTACILALGLALTGRPGTAVFDGSWTEWGGRSDLPVETGPRAG